VASVEKVAVSLDPDLLRRAERLRRSTGETRSALVSRALRLLVERENHRARVEQYVAAYRAHPESVQEVELARVLASRAITSIDWDEE
jgi:metal-responsive CopG/Arc/MetJ family transcriptional regulator